MIKNDADQIAVAYYQTIPHAVKVLGRDYAFVVRANICMAWVNDSHVEKMLSLVKECCGGSKKKVYRLANESDVRRWTNGGGR